MSEVAGAWVKTDIFCRDCARFDGMMYGTCPHTFLIGSAARLSLPPSSAAPGSNQAGTRVGLPNWSGYCGTLDAVALPTTGEVSCGGKPDNWMAERDAGRGRDPNGVLPAEKERNVHKP